MNFMHRAPSLKSMRAWHWKLSFDYKREMSVCVVEGQHNSKRWDSFSDSDILSQPPGGFTAAADHAPKNMKSCVCWRRGFGLTNKTFQNEHLYVCTYFMSSFKFIFFTIT